MLQSTDLPIVPLPDKVESGKTAASALEGLAFDDAISKIANSIVDFSFKLLIAIVVFYVGKFVITKIYRFVRSIMIARKVDASLTTFVLSLIRMVLYFILIITIVGILGIETSSFLALFASAGVAIGMALSGTLQNFAGGVLILLLKPYKVGDYIEAGGFAGTVKEIQIFHTIINTVDNKAIIIPNGGLSTGSINNYSLESYRRVDWTVSLSYGDDFEHAREVILKMLDEDSRIVKHYMEDELPDLNDEDDSKKESLIDRVKKNVAEATKKDCKPFGGLSELADSSINITVRAWTQASNYWPLYFEMNERFYKELPQHGFNFPFPQMDVHITK
ncbi:MAG: mechanosensitive ion channel [Muribaculaceae bacterium]|nr:mechanosensitive ion channel [Muribaculaceae bacterium]